MAGHCVVAVVAVVVVGVVAEQEAVFARDSANDFPAARAHIALDVWSMFTRKFCM